MPGSQFWSDAVQSQYSMPDHCSLLRIWPATLGFVPCVTFALLVYFYLNKCLLIQRWIDLFVFVCVRLQQLDQHCQASSQQVLQLLTRQNQLMQERQQLAEEMKNLKVQVSFSHSILKKNCFNMEKCMSSVYCIYMPYIALWDIQYRYFVCIY